MMHQLLVIDDDRDMATVIAELLASEGFAVTMLHNGQQAFDHLNMHPIDLIVSDIRMPIMDGLTLTARIRAIGLLIPIILMSAHEHQHHVLQYENVTFLRKPVDIEVLIDTIHTALRNPRSHRRFDA